MKLSLGAGAMLVMAVVAGAAGGAVAFSAAAGSEAPGQGPVVIHQVAQEPTPAPSASPTPSAAPVKPADVDEPEEQAAPLVHRAPEPVSEPEPKVVAVAPKTETATQAADRAKAEADRAKEEADRAAKVATAPDTTQGTLGGAFKNGKPVDGTVDMSDPSVGAGVKPAPTSAPS